MNQVALSSVEEIVSPIKLFEALCEWAVSAECMGMPLHDVEIRVATRGREVLRSVLQRAVDARGHGDVGPWVEVVAGVGNESGKPTARIAFTNRRVRQRTIQSMFGPIDIERTMYYRAGDDSVVPLDEQLQVPERSFSYVMQQKIATSVARGPFAEAVKVVKEATGVRVAPANVDGVARAAAVDFDGYYEAKSATQESAGPILAIACDGKGVRMRGLKGATRELDRKGDLRYGRKREALVAAVYTIEPYARTIEDVVAEIKSHDSPRDVASHPDRPRPENKRVWATLTKRKPEFFKDVAAEAERRDPGHDKTWVVLMDGAKPLQCNAEEAIGKRNDFLLILDIFHVLGYLRDASHAFHSKKAEASVWFERRLRMVLEGKASATARGMLQSATKRNLKGKRLKAVKKTARYLLNNKQYMRYDDYLDAGLPIGSGAAEGACRHVVKDRMERAGMSWTVDTAEAVLRLRALEITGDTADYWVFHVASEQRRLHGGRRWEVPADNPSQAISPRLRLVK